MDSLTTNHHCFLSGANSSNYNRFLFNWFNNSKTIRLHDNEAGNLKLEYSGLSDDSFFRFQWVNLVLSRDLQGASFYYCGSLKHRSDYSTSSLSIAENGLWIGADQDSIGGGWVAHEHLHGSLDEYRIYDRALSAEEISLLYRADSPNHFVDSAKDLEMIWVEPNFYHGAG